MKTFVMHPAMYYKIQNENPELFRGSLGLPPIITDVHMVDWKVLPKQWRRRKFSPPCRGRQYQPYAFPSEKILSIEGGNY